MDVISTKLSLYLSEPWRFLRKRKLCDLVSELASVSVSKIGVQAYFIHQDFGFYSVPASVELQGLIRCTLLAA